MIVIRLVMVKNPEQRFVLVTEKVQYMLEVVLTKYNEWL